VIARVGTHLKLRSAQKAVEAERQKSERLLLSILPERVAEELKNSGKSDPQFFSDVTILFSDLVGFTEQTAKLDPATLIRELNDLFTGFDRIMAEHGCERIKTIGDAYFAACGIPEPRPDHASRMVKAALGMRSFLDARNRESPISWEMRIGIHSGCAVAGIVGTNKYIYDVFGDTVNTASRLECASIPGRINISGKTAALLDGEFQLESRGEIDAKGKGLLPMFFVAENCIPK